MEAKKVIYIAGPISGTPRYWEAFEKAEDELSAAGYIPLSPSRLPAELGNQKAMQVCIGMINAADGVLLLPGWKGSRGAQTEFVYCEYVGKPLAESVEELKEVLRQ